MGKAVKGKGTAPKLAPVAGGEAGLKRLERNRARREQRRAKRAAEKRAELQAKLPEVQPKSLIDEYADRPATGDCDTPPTPPSLMGGAVGGGTNEAAVEQGRVGHVYGSPLREPDLRLGRRSVKEPWEPTRVYDVRIVRATDNAVTIVSGLSAQKAEELMVECARWMPDLVSVSRSARTEY